MYFHNLCFSYSIPQNHIYSLYSNLLKILQRIILHLPLIIQFHTNISHFSLATSQLLFISLFQISYPKFSFFLFHNFHRYKSPSILLLQEKYQYPFLLYFPVEKNTIYLSFLHLFYQYWPRTLPLIAQVGIGLAMVFPLHLGSLPLPSVGGVMEINYYEGQLMRSL